MIISFSIQFTVLMFPIVFSSSYSLYTKRNLQNAQLIPRSYKSAENIKLRTFEEPCLPNPCINGGICVSEEFEASCECPNPYYGEFCEEDLCSDNPCNGGKCSVLNEAINCTCLPGFEGEFCEIDLCSNSPCENNGTCVYKEEELTCNCLPHFEGRFCQIDLCLDMPCKNGGTCKVVDEEVICSCLPHFEGKYCQINQCSESPCKNNGTCAVVDGEVNCTCLPHFEGKYCQIDQCSNNPCENNGKCAVINGEVTCTCLPHYKGKYCHIDLCWDNPCKNYGTCSVINGAITCSCSRKFYGEFCERDLCWGNPCKNYGTCAVINGEVTCTCLQNYKGKYCQHDPCSNSPCRNDGRCYIQNREAFCSCNDNFDGRWCENAKGGGGGGGCFHGSALVPTKTGLKYMQDIQLGDEIASGFIENGSYAFSPVIAFLDRARHEESLFVELKTDSNLTLLATDVHLVFRSTDHQTLQAVPAGRIEVGDFLYSRAENNMAKMSTVTSINAVTRTGVFSPLTVDGTIIVDSILASCYADASDHEKAHLAFLPLRMYHYIMGIFDSIEWPRKIRFDKSEENVSNLHHSITTDKSRVLQMQEFEGKHWYAKMLCWLKNRRC